MILFTGGIDFFGVAPDGRVGTQRRLVVLDVVRVGVSFDRRCLSKVDAQQTHVESREQSIVSCRWASIVLGRL